MFDPQNVNFAWDPSLDGKIRIAGFRNGYPIIEWTQDKLPDEFDFFQQWCKQDPAGARNYYKACTSS